MKRFLFACGFLALVAGGQANAAGFGPGDGYANGWSGGYIGLLGGFGWGDTEHFNSGFNSGTFDVDGGFVGFTSGHNWQSGSWVYGYESDTSYSWVEGDKKVAPCDVPCTTDLRWLSTYRLRAGPAGPNYFFYGTGGFALGTVEAFNDDETMVGWAAGVGLEGKIREEWRAKIEYLYIDLGDDKVYSFEGTPTKVSLDMHTVRAGLNYEFSIWDWLFSR